MNASRALAGEQSVALIAGTARDLIAQGPNKKLPRPRFLMAVFAFYGMLGLLSSFGTQAARVAVAFGGVAALTTVTVGAGGPAILGLLQRLSGLTQGTPTAATDSGAPPGLLGPVGGLFGAGGGGAPPGLLGPVGGAPSGLRGPVNSQGAPAAGVTVTRNAPSGLRGPVNSQGKVG